MPLAGCIQQAATDRVCSGAAVVVAELAVAHIVAAVEAAGCIGVAVEAAGCIGVAGHTAARSGAAPVGGAPPAAPG